MFVRGVCISLNTGTGLPSLLPFPSKRSYNTTKHNAQKQMPRPDGLADELGLKVRFFK